MPYCRIVGGAAVDIVPSFKDRFHSSLHRDFVPCGDDVRPGWVYDAETQTFSAPPPPPPPEPAPTE